MIGELLKIAGQCDSVRCDMAMLVLPDVFERTLGRQSPLFWPEATQRVRERMPGFRFMAEVYWDLEWAMLPAESRAQSTLGERVCQTGLRPTASR